MQVMSKIHDHRINSLNLYVETTFKEYLSFAPQIITNNDLQRKRVRTSKTIYSLLKTDLERGCVIPPLVLAITNNDDINIDNIDGLGDVLLHYISDHPEDVLILDGLQRTFTLMDAETEMRQKSDEVYKSFLDYKLRLEIYLNINKFGVLYRMLTLNTGQTPMSARHQLEMLYSDMLNTEIDGLRLVADTDGSADATNNEFLFKNAVEGFHSYMNRNELPIDRQELLENIKMLENMANESVDNDLFKEFLESYVYIYNALRRISGDHVISREELNESDISDSPFGRSVCKIFSTSQAFTGFGAAVGRMKDRNILTLNDIPSIASELEKSYANGANYEWIIDMLLRFDNIKASSKKIGNAQRMFFQYFFRELLNKEGDSYLNLLDAVENGYMKYNSQVN